MSGESRPLSTNEAEVEMSKIPWRNATDAPLTLEERVAVLEKRLAGAERRLYALTTSPP